MAKQKLEGIFSRSLKLNNNLFAAKLHNNPMAHQRTPADFLIHNKNGKAIYVECKECRMTDGRAVFVFDRLTQEEELTVLYNFSDAIECYIMILFKESRLSNSICFLLPLKVYKEFKSLIPKKSGNINDFKQHLSDYILEPQKGSLYKTYILENI